MSGDHVHVYEPPTGGSRLTLLLLHGTGGDERQLLELGRALDPQAGRLGVRGQVMEGPMPRFFRRLAEGVFDEDDLVRRTHALSDFIGWAAQHYGFDPGYVVAVGFSNGANIAASTLLLRPDALRAGVLMAPMVPLRPATLPDLSTAGAMIVAGRRDPIAPAEQAEQLAMMLTDAGAAVEVSWHDDGHQVPADQVEAARSWLGKWRAATAADESSSPP